MSQKITCPHCHQSYDLSEVLTKDIEKHLKESVQKDLQEKQVALEQKMAEFEEKKKNENKLFKQRLDEEMNKMANQLKTEAAAEQQEKIKALFEKLNEEQEKRKGLQRLEVEKMELEKQLKEKDEEHKLILQKERLIIEEELTRQISDQLLTREREKSELEIKKLQKQLDDQKKLTEESQRKLAQGSMQTQGEILELAIEEILRDSFPYDDVKEISKGRKGADCILIIRNHTGIEAGRIVFESKRTKDFKKEWIDKLKEDTLADKGDISVLVTQTLPKELTMFDYIEGVWICRFNEVISLVKSLREGVLKVARIKESEENKGEKKEMLYNYFTGNEFRQQVGTINAAYLALRAGIDKERYQMEKIWKEREKQIDKVLLNSNHLIGSIEGITGELIEGDNSIEGGD